MRSVEEALTAPSMAQRRYSTTRVLAHRIPLPRLRFAPQVNNTPRRRAVVVDGSGCRARRRQDGRQAPGDLAARPSSVNALRAQRDARGIYPSCDTEHIWRWMKLWPISANASRSRPSCRPAWFHRRSDRCRRDSSCPILEYATDPPPEIAAAYVEVAPWFEVLLPGQSGKRDARASAVLAQPRVPEAFARGAVDPAVRRTGPGTRRRC